MSSSWQLVVGGTLCFGALLVALLKLTTERTPRARGLAHTRSLAFASVAERAEAITDTVIKRGGKTHSIGDGLERAGLELRPGEFILIVVAMALTASAVASAAFSPLFGILLGLLVVALSKVVVNVLAGRRRAKFADQLADTLQLLTSSLRAGNGLSQAIDTVASEAETPTGEEFRRLVVEVRLGRDLSDSMQSVADRMRSPDMVWVVQAIDINREVGGNLTEILDTITATIRERGRLRRQISALTAEGKLSAIVVLSLPFGLAGFMAISNPSYISPLFTTTSGLVALAFGGILLAVGGLWLRKLVTPVI